MQLQKVLVFGAGVLGSFYGAKLQQAGHDVTLVARGQRLADLKEHGVLLEHFTTGKKEQVSVNVVDAMPEDDYYDICLVMVRRDQLDSALPVLAANTVIPQFLIMSNMASGPELLLEALGPERVLLGHVNAGGERRGPLVSYMTAEKMTIGEISGKITPRLEQTKELFASAGFPVVFSRNMDAWKRYHAALAGPLCSALYLAEGCNYHLAKDRVLLRNFIAGMREAFRVLRAQGYPIEPGKLGLVLWLPKAILVPILSKVLGTELFDIGGARHANAAREEMAVLNQELFALAAKAQMDMPVFTAMHRQAFGES